MKKIIIVLIFINAYSSRAQQNGSFAPLDPDFIKYQNEINSGILQFETSEGYSLGEIPSPVKPEFNASYSRQYNTGIKFPSVYDLRTLNLLTPVKTQGGCGSCWSFATMGSVESYWKKLGLADYDLSEQNLRTCHGFEYAPCDGGNSEMASAYLSRIDGPVPETDDPYNTSSTATCNPGFTPLAYVCEARFLPKDTGIIKQAIIDNGAIYTNMHWTDSAYNAVNYTYFYNNNGSTNHAVLLVGWDDNKNTAGGMGAWIIKNSWGAAWGESGYFYISYNDTKILSTVAYFPARLEYNPSNFLYMVDDLGWVSDYGYGNNDAYGLLRYETPIIAPPDLQIKKIGLYVNDDSTTVDIEIYDEFAGNVLSGLMESLPNQVCVFPGYYTFTLPFPIDAGSGDLLNNDVYIKVKYHTPGYNYPIPIEKFVSGYANPAIASDVCWISSNGAGWTKIGNGTATLADLCIRAYGGTALVASAGADDNICPGDSAIIGGGGGSTATGGTAPYNYSWSSNPPGFTASISNPTVTPLVTTIYTVTVTDADGSSSTDDVTITVFPLPFINLGNDTVICADATLNLDAGAGYIYAWSTGDTVQSLLIDSGGTGLGTVLIWVSVTDTNGCPDTDTINITFDVCSGIDDYPVINITSYPNPANDKLEISLPEKSEIEILNIEGQLLKNMIINDNHVTIDVSKFAKGMYFVKVKTKKGIAVKKFVKE